MVLVSCLCVDKTPIFFSILPLSTTVNTEDFCDPVFGGERWESPTKNQAISFTVDTGWVSSNLTPIPSTWSCLEIDPTGGGLSPQGCSFPDFRHQSQVQAFGTSDWPSIDPDSHSLLFGFNNLLKWPTELWEMLTYIYQFIVKDTDAEMHRVSYGGGEQSFHALPKHPTLRKPPCVQLLRSSPDPLYGFLWRLYYVGMID